MPTRAAQHHLSRMKPNAPTSGHGPRRSPPESASPASAGAGVPVLLPRWLLLAGHHRGGLALKIDVRLAADVDGGEVDVPAGEGPGALAWVVGADSVEAPC